MSDTPTAIPPVEEAGDLTKRGPNEPYLTKPTTQIDLERRQAIEDGETPEDVGEARSFAVEGNDTSDYIGTAPEYQTYANDTEAPLRAEEGPEARLEERAVEFLEAPKSGVTSVENEPASDPYPVGSTGTVDPGTPVPPDSATSEEIAAADAAADAQFEEEQRQKAEAEEATRLQAEQEEQDRLRAEEVERLRAEEQARVEAETAAANVDGAVNSEGTVQ